VNPIPRANERTDVNDVRRNFLIAAEMILTSSFLDRLELNLVPQNG
jgi:hypothetical protein